MNAICSAHTFHQNASECVLYFSAAQVQGQGGTEGHGEKPCKAVCDNGFSVSTVTRGATQLLEASPVSNMVHFLTDLAVNYFCTGSVWWGSAVSTYKLQSTEQPTHQTTGVTISKFRAGAINSNPNKRGQTLLSPCPASPLWMTPVLTYYHPTPFLDRHRGNKHAYQLT